MGKRNQDILVKREKGYCKIYLKYLTKKEGQIDQTSRNHFVGGSKSWKLRSKSTEMGFGLSNSIELQINRDEFLLYNKFLKYNKHIMLQSIPKDFQLAQFIESSVMQEMQQEGNVIKTPMSFFRKHEEVYVMAMSQQYLAFGLIQASEIAFVSYVPLVPELRLQKLFRNNQPNTQIIGFKLIFEKQQLEILFRNKKSIEEWIAKLSKKLPQFGFHEQFRPIRKIGKGGFATVYEVKRALDGNTFAVKAFSKASAFSTPSNKATIENEINILKTLNQDNLLHLYEVFQSENSLYLVMEMYTGGDLVTLIRKNNAVFSQDEIKSYMYDLLKGLKALDEMEIMHRDIKPENIMIRQVGDIKKMVIGDFGLASKTNLPKYLLERCGTPGYVAPEIANFKTGERLSSKCDIFSLGVIFHILLCRAPLFTGSNCDEVYSKNKKMEFDLDAPKYDSVDSQAMELLKKMLHEDPQERISAAQAMENPFFWEIHEYNKFANTPMTSGCVIQGMCDDFEEFTPIRQRLEFEVRN